MKHHSKAYFQKLLLLLKHSQITSLMTDYGKIDHVSDSDVSYVINKNYKLRDHITFCIKILSEPFKQYNIDFNHISFEEHMNVLENLKSQLKDFKMMPTEYSDLKFRYNFISRIMIPVCSYLGLYSEHLSLALMKYSYIIKMSLKSYNDNNLISHLLEINGIYHEYGKVSITMQNNHTSCTDYIKIYTENSKMNIDENSEWI